MKKITFILFCMSIVIPCQAKIIYVDDDSPSGDGSSWENAYRYLQDALQEPPVSGDEIWVGQGIYRPDETTADPNGTGDRLSTFQLVNGVALRGGYAGVGQVDPNDRDWELYETILSGDLEENDVGELTDDYSDAPPSMGENSYHVVSSDSVGDSTVIDGFTITSGNASSEFRDSNHQGGGIYVVHSFCSIKNCRISNNFAQIIYKDSSNDGGGGMFIAGGGVKIVNCDFIKNKTKNWGGAVFNAGSTEFISCRFKGNISSRTSDVFLQNWSPSFKNCIFIEGDIAIRSLNRPSCEINNCIIVNYETGIFLQDGVFILSNNILRSNTFNIIMNITGSPTVSISYCNIEGGVASIDVRNGTLNWLNNNINIDPNFVDPDNNDFHLMSQAGHWDETTQTWVQDNYTSPCIDAGNPLTPLGDIDDYEPYPNGGVINMGAYGGTNEASKSYFGTTPCENPIVGDINGDCRVDMIDFGLMALHWLEDNNI